MTRSINKTLTNKYIHNSAQEIVHSGYGLTQWVTTLHCNVVSHWLRSYPEWRVSVFVRHHIYQIHTRKRTYPGVHTWKQFYVAPWFAVIMKHFLLRLLHTDIGLRKSSILAPFSIYEWAKPPVDILSWCSGYVTGCPCGVWGRGLSTCTLI